MINWKEHEHEQVRGTSWPELTESEDYIVLHPMETEDDTLSHAGDYGKDKNTGIVNTDVRSTEQPSQTKNNNSGFESESRSSCQINENNNAGFETESRFSCQINEDLPSSRMEMDQWIDFPNYCIDLGDACNDSATTEMINDLGGAVNSNSVEGDGLHLDHESSMLCYEDKGNGDFLDCEWDTFGDFDDIEMLFRNSDSIYGHHIGDAEGFLSPSNDVIDSTAQSIPLPDLPLCRDQASEEGSTSFEPSVHSDKKSPLHRDEVDGQEIIPTFQNKEGNVENRSLMSVKDDLSYNYNQNQQSPVTRSLSTPQTFQSKAIRQEMQFGDAKPIEHHCSSSKIIFTGHGYPTYCVPGIPLTPHVQIDMNQKMPARASYDLGLTSKKRTKASTRLDVKPVIMTPQEKMEKLRRLQKIQAQLAIQQQHQQYSQMTSSIVTADSQSCSQSDQTKAAMTSTVRVNDTVHSIPSSLLDISAEQDESKGTSGLTYDPSLQETIYYQLQDSVERLDMRVRLCIRDSLLRLARSAMERQSAGDGSSTNKSNKDEDEVSADEESKTHDRSTWLTDSETDTNCIDRVVASLLFQVPTDSGPRLATYEHL